MKTLIPIAASTLLLAVPATAQRMGHANTNAPTVSQSIDLPEKGRVELTYTSITWASGRWAEALDNEATREQMRSTINETAEQEPLGSFRSSVNLVIGHQHVLAGSYRMAFMLDDEYQWQLSLSNEEKRTLLGLEFGSNPLHSGRLVIALLAGDENFTARLLIAFGDKAGNLPIAIDPAGEAAPAPINANCPMMQEPVDPSVTVTYEGQTIAFCCSDCIPQWNKLTEAERGERVKQMLEKTDTAAQSFTCPMHPEIRSAEPGKCPKCGMNLVRGRAAQR